MPPRRTRKKTQPKGRAGARRKSTGSPSWLWLIGGSALGAVIAVALFFHDQPRPDHIVSHKPTKAAPDERRHGDIFERSGDSKPVAATVVPVKPSAPTRPTPTPSVNTRPVKPPTVVRETRPATQPKPEVASKPPPPPVKSPKPGSGGPRYWLQAGAFRSAAQADSLKARLTLTGLPVRVVSGRGSNNILWYRVRVGPYSSKSAANNGRKRLKQQKIAPVLIKDRG